ncbi:hypothetical protein DBR42_14940 [Pelomonas sp. HMWF004]|nr:hypothetical protein DBR42_14940 [Pelomonas sp. HMWF004]
MVGRLRGQTPRLLRRPALRGAAAFLSGPPLCRPASIRQSAHAGPASRAAAASGPVRATGVGLERPITAQRGVASGGGPSPRVEARIRPQKPKLNFTLDPTRHAAPQVVEALRAAIISLELAPGSALEHSPFTGKTASILQTHEAILDAIATGDVDAAQQAVREHLSGTLASVEEIQQRYPEYLIV